MISMLTDRSRVDRYQAQIETRLGGNASVGAAVKLGRCCAIALLAAFVPAGDAASAGANPLFVVQAFVDAERTANLDTAMALLADDAFVLNAVGWRTADRNQLKWFINTEIWMRDDFRLHNPQVNGAMVSWSEPSMAPFYKSIGVAPVEFAFEATIERGKITSIVAHLPVGEITRIGEACQTQAKEPLLYGRPCSEFVQLAEAHTRRHLHSAHAGRAH
jgi:hypothetical protein